MKINRRKRIEPAILLIFVLLVTLSGCGLPQEADLSEVENMVMGEIDEIRRVTAVFESLENTRSIYYSRHGENEGEWCLFDGETSSETVISENDEVRRDIAVFLAGHNNGSIYRSPGGIIIEGFKNPLDGNYCDILKSDEPPERVANPYWDAGQDIELMNWERTVDGSKVHFTADHRKDRSSFHKGMYYRVDMEQADSGIYIYEIQEKYPWYSWLYG